MEHVLDAAGHRRSPATMPGYHRGRTPRNKGIRYPADPPTIEEIVRRTAMRAGVRRRFAPHQLRHAHAVEMAHEGVPLVIIQRQLGHANLGITSIYLQGIDSSEIIDTVHSRPAPVISASAGLIGR
jgi:integrase